MRELSLVEVEEISGGFDFINSVTYGSAIGGVGYGGFTLLAGGSTAAVTAAFGGGAAIGAIAGTAGYAGYALATAAGADRLGASIGTWSAGLC